MHAVIASGARLRRARVLVGGLTAAIAVGALALAAASPAAAKAPVWLCLPGHSPDPCTPGLSTTVYSPTLKQLGVTHPKQVKKPSFDCFYVYPTVSDQKTAVANLQIDPVERSIALYQAARYSQYCKVYAPMYRQATLAGIGAPGTSPTAPTPAQAKEGPADVAAAFQTYLKKYNHGRGFVLIGHSQGSFVLRQLIAKQVDSKPAVRKRLISAILMGGNVLVKDGSDVGGDFKHIPACHSNTQVGCVIAFSTFNAQPPADSLFGRTNQKGMHVLCTNPAGLAGGSGKLDPIFPSKPFAPGSDRDREFAADDHPANAQDRVGEHLGRLQRPLLVGRRCQRADDLAARRRPEPAGGADRGVGAAPARWPGRTRQPGRRRERPGRGVRQADEVGRPRQQARERAELRIPAAATTPASAGTPGPRARSR